MVFCCHSSKAKSKVKNTSNQFTHRDIFCLAGSQQEPPHIYEDIDREIALSQTKCAAKTAVTADPSCRESVKPPVDPNKPPQLPDREYLTDIDFVAQEFDLILRRPPELPDRSEEENSSKNLLVVGNVSESNIANELKPSDTPKSDGKLINYQLKTVTKSARPNQYNLTGPVKTTTTSNQQKPSQNSIQDVQKAYKIPMVDHQSGSPSVREELARKMPFSTTHSLGRAIINDSGVTSRSTTSSRQLPYRQPVTSQQVAAHLTDNDSQANNCPTYQNFVEVQQLQTEDTYENMNGEHGQSGSRPIPKKQQQLPGENPYQPLLFGPGSDEDEYMEVDMF